MVETSAISDAKAIGEPARAAAPTRTAARLAFIDNIRWSMIILVLSMHACDTYSPFGNWYYVDRPEAGLATKLFFGVYQSFLQAFFMAALFFIAGYFSAAAFDRKGFASFVRDRFLRLGVPTLLYMLAIGPLTQYFLSWTWGNGGFGHQWLVHLKDGEWLSETGPMWFCAALLLFSVAYGLARAAGWRERRDRADRRRDCDLHRRDGGGDIRGADRNRRRRLRAQHASRRFPAIHPDVSGGRLWLSRRLAREACRSRLPALGRDCAAALSAAVRCAGRVRRRLARRHRKIFRRLQSGERGQMPVGSAGLRRHGLADARGLSAPLQRTGPARALPLRQRLRRLPDPSAGR